ncbi:hypothetical protein ACO2Q7_04235 [Rathayibacter sp. KR2-224]
MEAGSPVPAAILAAATDSLQAGGGWATVDNVAVAAAAPSMMSA